MGAAGILDLKAALYKEQQEAQLTKEDPAAAAARRSRRTAGIDLSKHARKNAGVEERDRYDREHIKVITPTLITPTQSNIASSDCASQLFLPIRVVPHQLILVAVDTSSSFG